MQNKKELEEIYSIDEATEDMDGFRYRYLKVIKNADNWEIISPDSGDWTRTSWGDVIKILSDYKEQTVDFEQKLKELENSFNDILRFNSLQNKDSQQIAEKFITDSHQLIDKFKRQIEDKKSGKEIPDEN